MRATRAAVGVALAGTLTAGLVPMVRGQGPTPAAGEWPSADGLSADELRDALHGAIDDHVVIVYSSNTTNDAWDVVAEADADPASPGHVLGLYDNGSWPRASAGNDYWSREHVWPRSYGVGDPGLGNAAGSDLHNLFACESAFNGARGNLPFDDCTAPDCTPKPLLDGSGRANRMRGGDDGVWEVWPGRRGDVARALFYMDVRYEGCDSADPDCGEPDLVLTHDRSLVRSTGGATTGTAYMGLLDALVRWHLEDPPDALDEHRNEAVARFQRNRNPFIDHPEWVCRVWPGCPTVWVPWAGRRP